MSAEDNILVFPSQTKPENSKHPVHKFISLFVLNSTLNFVVWHLHLIH